MTWEQSAVSEAEAWELFRRGYYISAWLLWRMACQITTKVNDVLGRVQILIVLREAGMKHRKVICLTRTIDHFGETMRTNTTSAL